MQLKRFINTSLPATILVPTAIQTTQTIQASTYEITSISTPVKESDYNHLKEQRSIWTKIAKTALKKAIQNRSAVINAVYDSVYRNVKNAGTSNKVASNVALAIKEQWVGYYEFRRIYAFNIKKQYSTLFLLII